MGAENYHVLRPPNKQQMALPQKVVHPITNKEKPIKIE